MTECSIETLSAPCGVSLPNEFFRSITKAKKGQVNYDGNYSARRRCKHRCPETAGNWKQRGLTIQILEQGYIPWIDNVVVRWSYTNLKLNQVVYHRDVLSAIEKII
ncbi:hypothetical protein BVX99_02565 [bacterium F16]|nr:hypothetical protein BVX99_02565 [bacterium F16]